MRTRRQLEINLIKPIISAACAKLDAKLDLRLGAARAHGFGSFWVFERQVPNKLRQDPQPGAAGKLAGWDLVGLAVGHCIGHDYKYPSGYQAKGAPTKEGIEAL
jgi:hypothetical protein